MARWVFGNASVRQTPKKRYAGKPLTFVDDMIFGLVPPCNLHQFAVFIGAKYRFFFKVRRRLQMQSNSVQTPSYSIRSRYSMFWVDS